MTTTMYKTFLLKCVKTVIIVFEDTDAFNAVPLICLSCIWFSLFHHYFVRLWFRLMFLPPLKSCSLFISNQRSNEGKQDFVNESTSFY